MLLLLLLTPLSTRADGLIVIHNPPVSVPGHFTFAPLEVTFHHVTVDITDQTAVTSVDQEFLNPNNARLEGDYIFPLPAGARIDKFSMDIDGKQVEAELLPADKARKIYEDIVRASKDPALLEYAGRAMYKVRIFPIEPNSKKRIQLKYTELLTQDSNLVKYHYTLNTEKFSSKPLKNVSVKVTINSADPITSVYSPSHEIEKKLHGENKAVVGFEAKDIRPDTDFVLYYGKKATPIGINLLTYRPDSNKDGYFLLLASPTVSKTTKPMPKDVIFVMDTSGSMAGKKIEQARQALKFCVDTLNKDDRFDIVRFSTEAEPLFKSVVDATDNNRKKAVEFSENLKAAGGTAIDEALQVALKEINAETPERLLTNRLRMIVFMTDGLPTIGEPIPDRILAGLKEKVGAAAVSNTRIFSFGVGPDVNTKLLDLMAEQSRGYSQYVLPNENLEVSMSNFWGKVQDPILANLKLDTGTVAVSKMYPKDLPDLFKGDQLVAFGTYSKAGKTAITLKGLVNGKEEIFAQDVTFEESTDASKDWIAKLWATRRIGYLLDEIRLRGESKEVKEEVVELARKWGVVTPYTAMLIIEDEKNRHVPIAAQTLREMAEDRGAVAASKGGMDSVTRRDESGRSAVANSVNADAYKSTSSMEGQQKAAEQSDARLRFAEEGGAGGGRGGSLAKAQSPATTPSPTLPAASTPGALAMGGNKGKELNLGTYNQNGWQNASGKADKDAGYRVVTNYAQQSRVINNRAFYLNGSQWTDARLQNQNAEQLAKRIQIAFNSDAYFDLLKKFPDSAQYLSLGHNVTVELGGTTYDITEEIAQPEAK